MDSFEAERDVFGADETGRDLQRPSVVGYVRVSTSEQAGSGAGLEAQRQAIEGEAARRDWELVHVFEDAGVSGKSMNGRAGLSEALRTIGEARASVLVVAKLDRLSRSLLDFAGLMERARREGWSLVALDLGVDTSTPAGEMMASVLATFAQFERRLIGQRTRDALAVKRGQGVGLGRPRADLPPAVTARIHELHQSGESLSDIARILNSEEVLTPRGNSWHPTTVRRVVLRVEAA